MFTNSLSFVFIAPPLPFVNCLNNQYACTCHVICKLKATYLLTFLLTYLITHLPAFAFQQLEKRCGYLGAELVLSHTPTDSSTPDENGIFL